MKVILQQDVANLGKKSTVVEVPNGYALNKLIPSGMAVAATAENQKQIEIKQAQDAETLAEAQATLNQVREAMTEETVVVTMEANEKGLLFQAVAPQHIVEAVKAKDIALTEEMVLLPENSIKQVGTHEIQIVAGGEMSKVSIEVAAK
jgi:large subunit ribosomal protein L9